MSRRVLPLLLLLAGCVSMPPEPRLQSVVRPTQAEQTPFSLFGRVIVRHHEERSSSSVRWVHRIGTDEVLLLGPLGQTVARIHRNPEGAVLDTASEHHTGKDVDVLTQQMLGWRLPLSGLRYWVLALPAPSGTFEVRRDGNGQVDWLSQDGWVIRYTRYAAPLPDSLPLRITLQRDGLEIQLLIDEWEI